VKGIGAFRIQLHEHVIFILASLVKTCMMDVTLRFPLFGSQQFHRGFIFRRKNHDRSPEVYPKRCERHMKHCADLLELLGDSPPLLLTRVGRYNEVRTSHFDPVLVRIARTQGRRPR